MSGDLQQGQHETFNAHWRGGAIEDAFYQLSP
jgi:hypothetical protein